MKALISPNEIVYDPNTNVLIGQRVAEVNETGFEVAPPLFWMDCDLDIISDVYYYDPANGQIQKVPELLPPPEPVQPVVDGAQTL